MFIEIPHGISTAFVLLQDLSNELTFGEIGMIPLYVPQATSTQNRRVFSIRCFISNCALDERSLDKKLE